MNSNETSKQNHMRQCLRCARFYSESEMAASGWCSRCSEWGVKHLGYDPELFEKDGEDI